MENPKENLRENLERVLKRIERARLRYDAHHIVSLVAVSKYHTHSAVRALYEYGQRAFGENKVQDLRAKSESLDDLPLEWHFLGHLQENKINTLLSLKPSLVHSLDSLKLAQSIQKRLGEKKLRALVQVNPTSQTHKYGTSVQGAVELYEQICAECPNIILEGVMCIGEHSADRQKIEQSFALTRDVFDALRHKGAKILSMGMSEDFEIAIAYGANLVRIGSKLFESNRI